MPAKPARPCRYPRCPHLTRDKSGYCPEHVHLDRQRRKQADRERGSAAARGYDRRWQRYRNYYLAEHPLCALCAKKDPPVVREATVVDHIIPHRSDYDLFWDPNNHQPACKECHDRKTASEDGGFGNHPRGV